MNRISLIVITFFLTTFIVAQEESMTLPKRSSHALVRLQHNHFQHLDSIKGNPKKIIEQNYGRHKKLKYSASKLSHWKTIYFYTNNNLIDRKESYLKNKKTEDINYIYDEKRNKISEIINFGEDKGKIQFRKQIRYDSLGRLILVKEYFSTGELFTKDTLFKYSISGDTISYNTTHYLNWKNSATSSNIVEIYDSLNRLIITSDSTINQLFKGKRTFVYDEFSNLKEIHFQWREPKTGKLSEPEKQIFEYTYDRIGNWIFKYQLVDGNMIPLSRRKIEY